MRREQIDRKVHLDTLQLLRRSTRDQLGRQIAGVSFRDRSRSRERRRITSQDEVRQNWSELRYKDFGTYTGVNGALLTWATSAGA